MRKCHKGSFLFLITFHQNDFSNKTRSTCFFLSPAIFCLSFWLLDCRSFFFRISDRGSLILLLYGKYSIFQLFLVVKPFDFILPPPTQHYTRLIVYPCLSVPHSCYNALFLSFFCPCQSVSHFTDITVFLISFLFLTLCCRHSWVICVRFCYALLKTSFLI